jgi:hypothetical protein
VRKVISVILFYILLLLSATGLSADQKLPKNGNGYGHGYDIGDGTGNGYGYGHTERPPGTNAPEPISSALFVLGGAGLGLYRKFKNKN